MLDGIEFYLRLQLLLLESCKVLRKLLVHNAKTDTSIGVPYTTLDAYIKAHKSAIDPFVNGKILHKKQCDLLFNSGKAVTADDMDITLLSFLLLNIFKPLSPKEEQWIQDIREVRNTLNHYDDLTTIDSPMFNKFWQELEKASTSLSRSIHSLPDCAAETIKSIHELKDEPLPPPGPYMEIITDLIRHNRQIEDIKDAVETNSSYMKNLVHVRQNKKGPPSKRMRVLHPNLDRMQGSFRKTLSKIPESFKAPKEVKTMEQYLVESRHLYVTGPPNSLYLETTLCAIKSLDIEISRCVEMGNCSDWRDVNKDDVDLVLFKDPFCSKEGPIDQIQKCNHCFDNMLTEFSGQPLNEKMYIIITSDYDAHLEYKRRCKGEPHDILSNCVVLEKPTSEEDPILLTDNENASTSITSGEESVLRNLQGDTAMVTEAVMYTSRVKKSLMKASFERRNTLHNTWIWSELMRCTFMPSGHLVLVDGEFGVVLIDTDLTTIQSTLNVGASDIGTMSNTEVIIVPDVYPYKYLQYISVSPPHLAFGERIDVGVTCICVDVFNDELYVGCSVGDETEIRILNRQGVLLKTLHVDMLLYPDSFSINEIKVSRNGDKVFIIDGCSVICMSTGQGRVIYTYNNEFTGYIMGMYADEEDNLLFCGDDHLLLIDTHGIEQTTFKALDSVDLPHCVCYRESDSCLVIGSGDRIDAFTVKW